MGWVLIVLGLVYDNLCSTYLRSVFMCLVVMLTSAN